MFLVLEESHVTEEVVSKARDILKMAEKPMSVKAPFTLMMSRRRRTN